ncbi:MAG: RIP metalloprotease [Salinibacterium sp.]|nr:MAG: RIP metalloprotease [Salinibacterium sp.]
METALLYLLGILIAIVGLALSIGLHELGHLVPAKLFGVRVSQYMIGFGPTLFSWRRGETEYGFKTVPLGGYISMAGMFPPAKPGTEPRTSTTGLFETLVQDAPADDDLAEKGRTFYQLPVYKRVIVMLGGPFMNLVIAVVLTAIVLCGFGIAQPSTTIGTVSKCVQSATAVQTKCRASDPATPAFAAGLKPGDRILQINGTSIDTWDEATAMIRKSTNRELSIVVERDGNRLTLEAVPVENTVSVTDEFGRPVKGANGKLVTHRVGFLGISPAVETVRQSPASVLPAVGDNIVRVGNLILHLPERMVAVVNAAFGPDARDPNGPVSVVGVGRLAGEITSLNSAPVADRASSLIGLLAGLNIALFVFNLVPLMPLDGGHVAGALIEGIRRFLAKLAKRPDPGPIDITKLIPLTLAVVAILAVMSLILIYADIVKPISIL